MRILVFSPLELPFCTGARYTGLERLAAQFATEWAKLGHDVTVLCHKDTTLAPTVKILPCDGYETIVRPDHAEVKAFQRYQSEFYKYDIVWDIGHLHLIARYMPQIKTCNVFSANPEYEHKSGSIKAPKNLISWSKWGVGEIARYYKNGVPTLRGGQIAVYQETIMIDPNVYKPGTKPRTNRFLTMGRMAEPKGNLNAAQFCKSLGLPLDIAGGRGSEKTAGQELTPYEQEVMKLCDGKQIVYHGEVSEEEKIELMQSCRALLYITNHIEITSHKIQEAMLGGAPVIVPDHGGFPEIVTQGVDGYLCRNLHEYAFATQKLHFLHPELTRERVVAKYNPETVARNYIGRFNGILQGETW